MPVRNDAAHVGAAIGAVLAQEGIEDLEVVVAIGPSTDGTERVIEAIRAADGRVHIVANPTGGTAAGLNAAIAATRHPVIARVDSHCVIPDGYLAAAATVLRSTGAVNAGGVQHAVGDTAATRAIAAAMTSRFGVGDARFHYGGAAGPADTVYLGVFDRAALLEVGGYDESLVRNQDYELNWRLRDHGGIVWFDPELVVEYRPRASLRRLASQYFQYGQWKRVVIRRHPRSVRPRQLVAPVTVVGLVSGTIGAVSGRRWMAAAPVVYGLAVVAASATTDDLSPRERLRLCAVFPAMHLSWGAGFLIGPRRVPR